MNFKNLIQNFDLTHNQSGSQTDRMETSIELSTSLASANMESVVHKLTGVNPSNKREDSFK